ncbi:peptidoglycan-binding protein [Streptomyces sp. YU58]|uniref:peptidoglycan-binding protein n=1 Tax=Streptomyces sp. SX92 TaxID=3158972 RepID=UPI0027B88FA2|nr:peptidoglycan-binding protein [Streptomyces coralus]WLW54836.1 peptidoglycan-binding protein [Streptomyces coralus]
MNRSHASGDVTSPGAAVAGSRLARRRRWTVVAACSSAVLSAGGVYATQWVQSPAEAAARTQAPQASVITAPVVRQVLRNTLVFRGSFSDGRTVTATPTGVAATQPASQPSASQPSALVVTDVFARPGQRVKAAQPLVEYDARPVFALPGAFPMYRDLTVGDEGKDVVQVQRALHSLGRPTGSDPSGTFGSGTAAAVRHMYAAMGYAPPLTTSAGTVSQDPGPEATTTLPSSEVVFVPSLPARVVSVPVHVGDAVKGPVVTLARGDMTLTGFLDPSERGLVTAGAKADILAEATGAHATGTVASVGALVTPGAGKDDSASDDSAADARQDSAYVPVRIGGGGSWDKTFAGQDVRITITAAATSRAVTAVPEAAITAGADARSTVTVVPASGGAQRVVPVTTGVSADGLVQVTPTRGHTLRAGDRVVVGT